MKYRIQKFFFCNHIYIYNTHIFKTQKPTRPIQSTPRVEVQIYHFVAFVNDILRLTILVSYRIQLVFCGIIFIREIYVYT